MAGVLVDSAILTSLLHKYFPDLYNYMVKIGYEMNLNNLIYKWFLSLFSQSLSYNVLINNLIIF
jgi:hypothetical protein